MQVSTKVSWFIFDFHSHSVGWVLQRLQWGQGSLVRHLINRSTSSNKTWERGYLVNFPVETCVERVVKLPFVSVFPSFFLLTAVTFFVARAYNYYALVKLSSIQSLIVKYYTVSTLKWSSFSFFCYLELVLIVL